jgi:hypothetical protein
VSNRRRKREEESVAAEESTLPTFESSGGSSCSAELNMVKLSAVDEGDEGKDMSCGILLSELDKSQLIEPLVAAVCQNLDAECLDDGTMFTLEDEVLDEGDEGQYMGDVHDGRTLGGEVEEVGGSVMAGDEGNALVPTETEADRDSLSNASASVEDILQQVDMAGTNHGSVHAYSHAVYSSLRRWQLPL